MILELLESDPTGVPLGIARCMPTFFLAPEPAGYVFVAAVALPFDDDDGSISFFEEWLLDHGWSESPLEDGVYSFLAVVGPF